jgi:isoamylase
VAPRGQWLAADDAYNFALYSRHATGVTLLGYAEKDPARPVSEFRLQHPAHKTGSIWHCRIPAGELHGATLYAYRVEGPHEPECGKSFAPEKILLDPSAPAVFFPPKFRRETCARPGPTDGCAPLGRLPKKQATAMARDSAPPHGIRDAVIYELHEKGSTARANSGVTVAHRGTAAGLQEKIPCLKELGVTIPESAGPLADSLEAQLGQQAYRLKFVPSRGVTKECGSIVWMSEENGRVVCYTHEPKTSFLRRLQVNILSRFPIESQL